MHCFVDPPVPANQDSPDNENGSLLVYLHDIFDFHGENYIVQDVIGDGTYSDVYKVLNIRDNMMYAMKVSRSLGAMDSQAQKEVRVLTQLQQCCDDDSLMHYGRMIGHFMFKGHTIIILDVYVTSLYRMIVEREFTGFPLSLVQKIARDMVMALRGLNDFSIIHTDIKPENIVIDSLDNIRLIDFGGCIYPSEPLLVYIQSRWYRAPEVLLERPFTRAIDIWSFGCVLVEAFIGVPIFAGTGPLNMLQLIEQRVSNFPKSMISSLEGGPAEYFNTDGSVKNLNSNDEVQDIYQFNVHNLSDIILNGPSYISDEQSRAEYDLEMRNKRLFLDLVSKMLTIDPNERISLEQVGSHSFLSTIL